MELEEVRNKSLEGGIEPPKEGDLLELIEAFFEWPKGTQCICLEYNKHPKCWGYSSKECTAVRTDKVKSDDDWVLARRFRIIQRAPSSTEGWTL